MTAAIHRLPFAEDVADPHAELLDRVFFALSDPLRRSMLQRLGEKPALVSELAAPYDVSLQAVSRHVQVLVQAGLVQQERSGRVARCRLEVGAMFAAAVWINEYSRYWQAQFDTLARWVKALERQGPKVGGPKVRRPKVGGPKVGGPKVGGPKVGGPKVGGPEVRKAPRVAEAGSRRGSRPPQAGSTTKKGARR